MATTNKITIHASGFHGRRTFSFPIRQRLSHNDYYDLVETVEPVEKMLNRELRSPCAGSGCKCGGYLCDLSVPFPAETQGIAPEHALLISRFDH